MNFAEYKFIRESAAAETIFFSSYIEKKKSIYI